MTKADLIIEKLKNNWIIAVIVVLSTILISVATFMDAFKKIFLGNDIEKKESAGGLIENPKSPSEYYHNARIYELGGDIKKAKESYLKYFDSDQDYIDPHLYYQELLKNAEGIEEAIAAYKNFLNDKPSSQMYQYLYARLQDRDTRILLCKQIYGQDSTYMPVIFQLAIDYSSENNTISRKTEKRKYLERFNYLNKNNSFFKYYIDKKEAIKAIEYMNRRLIASKNNDQYYLNNPVEVTLTSQVDNNIYLSFYIKELCFEIFFKMDGDTGFVSTGLTDMNNPITNTKYPNYSILIPNVKAGKHKIGVKYVNLNHEVIGPIDCEINVLTKTEFDLKSFVEAINAPNIPKQIYMFDNKEDLIINLMNLSVNNNIVQNITLQGLKDDKDDFIFNQGKNLTGDIYGVNTFYFKDIKKGKYTLIFTINLINKGTKKLKFDIEVLQNNETRTVTGEMI